MVLTTRKALPALLLLVLASSLQLHAQALSSTTNALDRINFGDTSTDAYAESKHAFVNLGNPTGTGALGLTYREIAPSATTANIGTPADNEVLTFTMACSSTLQNYLTIQLWGGDTTEDVIYLYNSSQGYGITNYYSTDVPEIDYQSTTDPMLPGRFVYETIPIPLSMTTGKTSVTLTLNAAASYYYYNNTTTNLAAGQTSKPIYAAFTHTNPYLIVNSTDPQGTAPTATAPTPATLNSTYLSGLITSMSTQLQSVLTGQVYGTAWQAAVSAGTVPPQIYGYFDSGKSPSNSYTIAQWLNNAALDTQNGNNVSMERLDEIAFAYVTPNFITSIYQNVADEQALVAALDSYSYMQALNGSWGDMTGWDGVGATTATTSNPYGRVNTQGNPIEGAGTWAIGSAIVQLSTDANFLASLDQPISTTLEPGVKRYQAYQTMLSAHLAFLAANHGHAPNQDLLQARAYVYTNLALQFLDKRYGTSLAVTNDTVEAYEEVAAGISVDPYGGYWFSQRGLGLEVNGTGNGAFDGGYGLNDVNLSLNLAKILNDNGIETTSNHPVRTIVTNGVQAFSIFLYPHLLLTGSTYTTTQRIEEVITFRKNLDVGEILGGGNYDDAITFADPYSVHGFYREKALGMTWTIEPMSDGHFDDIMEQYLHQYPAYATLCNMSNTESDPSGVTFLTEAAHPDGVWADPTGSSIAIKHNGELLYMVLNWRQLQTPGQNNKPSAANEIVNNLARIHDTTATMDRVATIEMPASTATGASGSYTSGAFGTLYIGRYGNYLVGLNWQSTAATMALAPDMTAGTATDLISGTTYDLTRTTSVSVPALSAVAIYQSLPTATLSTSSLSFGSLAANKYSTMTVTLSNTGTGPLLIGSASITGTNASDFTSTTTCTASLAASNSCTYSITFAPQGAGTRAATFSLVTCLSATAQTVTLTGTGSSNTLTVTASNATRAFDAVEPTFTYSITGFTGSDTQANATTGAPLFSSTDLRNSPAGTYSLNLGQGTLAAANYYFQLVSGTLTVAGGAPQKILFFTPPGISSGGTLQLSAISTSGLPLTYSVVSGPGTITGSVLTSTATGTIVVQAAQAGNTTYGSASPVQRSVTAQ